MKWNRSSALLGTALIGAVALAGCPQNGGGGGGILGGGGGGGGTVATVNGQGVARSALHSQLEATHGEDALRQLIDFELVMQELKNKNLEVTDAEINAVIDQRSKESEAVAKLVKTPGPAQEALKRQVRYQLAIDKLLTADIKVTDDQLKAWFEKNKTRYDVPERVKIGFLISATKVRADTMAQQLKSKSKTFMQLVEEQKAAKDNQAKASLAEIPDFTPTTDLPKELRDPLVKLKKGETSNVLTLGEGPQRVYAIIRLVDKQEGKKADLATMKAQVENDYKLEQVAKKLVAENPSNPPFEETIKRVEMQVAQQGPRPTKPTYHDILSYITQTGAGQLTTRLRSTAKVEISDQTYSKVGEEFKALAAPTGAPAGAPAGGPADAGDHSGHDHATENKAAPDAKK